MKFLQTFNKKIKLKHVKNLCFVLAILWIIIKITKMYMNHDGLTRYKLIQQNTIGYWFLISVSFYLSKLYYKKYSLFYLFLFGIVIIHEILWYGLPMLNLGSLTNITKDEGEVTNNWYEWANNYTDELTDLDNNDTDLSEGIFDNDWTMSNKDAMKNKYDTYYKYLKLKPGMKLLDIGCGNCFWLKYCKDRGIECTGITITADQQTVCAKYNIKNIYVGNIKHDILETVKEKFDAITANSPAEHFSSISETQTTRLKALTKYYSQVQKLINPHSSSRRYLNSIMNTNVDYSYYQSPYWFYQIYLVASAFGYGYYPLYGNNKNEIDNIYNSGKSKIIIKRDYTEDYRWIFARNKNKTVGQCKYNFKTPSRIFNFFKDILIDPAWLGRLLYGINDSWLWQFGGTSLKPIPHIKDTPIRSFIFVTEINNI